MSGGEREGDGGCRSKVSECNVDDVIMVEDHIFPVRALVDTGAEVNIIRRGVIPERKILMSSCGDDPADSSSNLPTSAP